MGHSHFAIHIARKLGPDSMQCCRLPSIRNPNIKIKRFPWPPYIWKIISWWRHPMETFSALLAICAGKSPVTGEFPPQRPVTRSFDVFFDLSLNERLSKHRGAGDLRHHRAHYDVIVMFTCQLHDMETFFAATALLWGEPPVTGGLFLLRTRDAELWCFLCFTPTQTAEPTVEFPVIMTPGRSCDANVIILKRGPTRRFTPQPLSTGLH